VIKQMSNKSADKSDEGAGDAESGFNLRIASHSTYIDETKRILRTYTECESYDELEKRIIEENILHKKTDDYKEHVLREVTRRHIPDTEDYTETPLIQLLNTEVRSDVADWCLYYEFAQDPFIRVLTLEFLYPEYQRGILSIQTEDVVTFLESIEEQYSEIQERSETTIEKAAAKYLTSLRNFGLLEGTQKKEFAVTYVPDEAIAYILYRLFDKGVTSASEIISHQDWKLLLMDESEVQRRVRDISPQYISYEKRGSTERLVPNYDSTEDLINDL